MGSRQPVIPPPPDGSGIVDVPPPPDGSGIATSGAIPPPPDGSGIVETGGGSSGSWEAPEGPIKRFAKAAGRQLNPVEMVKGAAHMVAHPADTIVEDTAARGEMQDKAKEDFHQGSYMQGVTRTLASLVPLLGPQFGAIADRVDEGDLAGAAGSASGLGLSLGAPSLLKDAKGVVSVKAPRQVGIAAEGLYKSALKPSTVNTAKAARAVRAGLDEGITVSEKGVTKRGGLMKDLNAEVDQTIAKDPGRPIDVNRVGSKLDKLESDYSKQALPEADMETVRGAKKEFTDRFRSNPEGPVDKPLTAGEAQEMKKATYQSIGKRAWDERKGAGVQSEKKIALDLRDQLQEQFPDIEVPNRRESGLFDLKKPLETAVAREKNKNPLGLGHGIAAMTGGAAGLLTHNPTVGVATALGGVLLENAALRSKIAIALNKVSKGTLEVPIAKIRIQGYINAATRGTNSRNEESSQATTRQE